MSSRLLGLYGRRWWTIGLSLRPSTGRCAQATTSQEGVSRWQRLIAPYRAATLTPAPKRSERWCGLCTSCRPWGIHNPAFDTLSAPYRQQQRRTPSRLRGSSANCGRIRRTSRHMKISSRACERTLWERNATDRPRARNTNPIRGEHSGDGDDHANLRLGNFTKPIGD